jgi:hypothetical protein
VSEGCRNRYVISQIFAFDAFSGYDPPCTDGEIQELKVHARIGY